MINSPDSSFKSTINKGGAINASYNASNIKHPMMVRNVLRKELLILLLLVVVAVEFESVLFVVVVGATNNVMFILVNSWLSKTCGHIIALHTTGWHNPSLYHENIPPFQRPFPSLPLVEVVVVVAVFFLLQHKVEISPLGTRNICPSFTPPTGYVSHKRGMVEGICLVYTCTWKT